MIHQRLQRLWSQQQLKRERKATRAVLVEISKASARRIPPKKAA